MVEYKDGGWWRISGKIWIRDTPNWKELHPLGPVHFDVMCPECDWKIVDVKNPESNNEKMCDHFWYAHESFRYYASKGIVLGNGDGI